MVRSVMVLHTLFDVIMSSDQAKSWVISNLRLITSVQKSTVTESGAHLTKMDTL